MASAECEKCMDWRDTSVNFYNNRREGIGYWIGELGREMKSELQAWKVTDDKVVSWKHCEAKEGRFFSDEVYIVLNSADKQPNTMLERRVDNLPVDIYCWAGKSATPDLYRKGLYNAIALDEAMQGKSLVHREVQDFESKRFINKFKFYAVLKGSEQGPEYKKTRLLRVTGPIAGTICIRETSLKRGAMRESNDVFIVDKGLEIFLWIGSGLSNSDSKVTKAMEYITELKAERNKRMAGGGRVIGAVTLLTLYENDAHKSHLLYDVFPPQAKKPIVAKKPKSSSRVQREASHGLHAFMGQKLRRKMFHVKLLNPVARCDHDFCFREECEEEGVCMRKMDSANVYVIHLKDCEDHLFVRVGSSAWTGEKGNGLIIGHDYLKTLPAEQAGIPITVVKEGQYSLQLRAAIGII